MNYRLQDKTGNKLYYICFIIFLTLSVIFSLNYYFEQKSKKELLSREEIGIKEKKEYMEALNRIIDNLKRVNVVIKDDNVSVDLKKLFGLIKKDKRLFKVFRKVVNINYKGVKKEYKNSFKKVTVLVNENISKDTEDREYILHPIVWTANMPF